MMEISEAEGRLEKEIGVVFKEGITRLAMLVT